MQQTVTTGTHDDADAPMTPRGFELTDANPLSLNSLQQSPQPGAAQSGAVTVEALLAMLATLSPADRARLAALLSGQAEGEARS
jgi:hypothetical protein